MFDIGWTEMALIAVVAVIVIGPKELPKVMRELGTWVARARGMSRAFMEQLEEMSRQSGIDEVRKEAEALRRLDPARQIEKTVDPDGVIARQTADIGQIGGGQIGGGQIGGGQIGGEQIGAPSEPSLPKPADPTSSGEAPSVTPPMEPPAAQTAGPAQPTPDAAPPREPGESKP